MIIVEYTIIFLLGMCCGIHLAKSYYRDYPEKLKEND